MWTVLLIALAADAEAAAAPTADQIKFYETSIRPVLAEHCLKCHGPDKQWAAFRLDSRDDLIKGGEGGAGIVPGKPGESRLIEAIRQTDPDFKMPPEGKLTDQQIADFVKWVEIGAPYPAATAATDKRKRDPNHWSFQPAARHPVPEVAQKTRLQSPIDAFIVQKLEAAQVTPAPAADRSALLRRITFDLLGVPPTAEDVLEFLADDRPDAVARLTDRLLASPKYGERWGRHWLDIARYADSNGLDENIAHGNAWRYRDYVVSAFNQDEPYSRFLSEQLAGDLIPAANEAEQREHYIATGFLSIGAKVLAEVDMDKMRMDIVDEQVETVGRALMGMTFGCARCHDHKFDPIGTADYYGLAGIFKSTRTMDTYTKIARWHEHELPSDELRTMKANYEKELADKQLKIDQVVKAATEELQQKTPNQKLPDNPETQFSEDTQKQLKQLREELDKFKKTPPDFPSTMGVTEDKVVDLNIQIRGNPLKLGDIAPRHVPVVMRGPELPTFTPERSGRQELAAWLTDGKHPLTARVMTNRIWRWHFGRGIVPSTDNFGLLGELPTHPELLDWLSLRFSDNGWSIKSLHREILSSATYQQSSQPAGDALVKDPDNRLLHRAIVRRLEAEEVRDSLLAASDQLDDRLGGPCLKVKNRDFLFDHTSTDKTDYTSVRRSMYLPVIRNNPYDFLQLLDFPDAAVPTGSRNASTVAPQALLLMNSKLVIDCAAHLAESLLANSTESQVRLARLNLVALGRPATAAELAEQLAFLTQLDEALAVSQTDPQLRSREAWAALCHTVFASNEFIYLR